MIYIEQRIQRKDTGLTRAEWNVFLQNAWGDAGVYWHQRILPKHFTTAGAREYGYQSRQTGYKIRKQRRKGHQRPLVWSGRVESEALGAAKIKASTSRVTITPRITAKYFYYRHAAQSAVLRGRRRREGYERVWSAPDMVKEIEAVSEADTAAIAKVLEKSLIRQTKALGAPVPEAGHRRPDA